MNTSVEGTTEGGVSSLEAEVAAWRTRRALRPEASTGKVCVVRIRKRTLPPAGLPAVRAPSAARS